MRIAVDIDGVLFPWDAVAREAVAARYATVLGPSTTWHGIRDAVPGSVWQWLWSAEGQDAVFGEVHRHYAEACAAVGHLLRLGHEVHFVTHRDPQRTLRHTAAFLDRHFGRCPQWAGVHSVRSHTPKRTLARWDVLIDDRPDTVLDVVGRETTTVFAPLRPWNVEALAGSEGPYLHVYTDPWDIVDWVETA